MHDKYRCRFNVRKMVEDFGGIEATHNLLLEAGSTIKPKSIQKWMERGYLPADAIASMVIGSRRKNGQVVSLEPYIEEVEEAA